MDLVEFRKQLALLHAIPVIHIKLFYDAAGLGLDLHFGKRLNLAGGHYDARQVTALRGSNLGRVNGAAWAECGLDAIPTTSQRRHRDSAPDDPAPLLTVFAVFPVA